MLDTDTKRRIDSCRDILVGKVPDPKSQVEQITIALIYKFMDDMDAEAEEFGGERTFFAGDFAKFGWAKLMAPNMGGFDVLALYSEAIQKMSENPGVPSLFRDIFKNAYLPYRDPETLRAFLKEIDGFTYDHSEKLGDAFEYLLSVLGSQGDAGQFRTPRHIIDFMVEIIDPNKDETIGDNACGTAGFLISAYKHILKHNSSDYQPHHDHEAYDEQGKAIEDITLDSPMLYKGDKLTPDERKRLAENIKGYDISPDMVRLSLVNLYLHGFTDPHIYEYDTLTSEERWNEFFDVIFANPPFMSPKGGIKPHKRFSVQSNRSEVLFVDYIAEHLTPNGRAAVVVPEGIIFQSGTAYKKLREMLVKNYLVTVISLPAGVFNPYSGVKTSILIMDKRLSKKTDSILFAKINNDGFNLGAQRRPIEKNDLPAAARHIKAWLQSVQTEQAFDVDAIANLNLVTKEKIAENGEWNLSGERYRENTVQVSSFTYVELDEVCALGRGFAFKSEDYVSEGILNFRVTNIGKDGKPDLSDVKFLPEIYKDSYSQYLLKEGDFLIVMVGATTGKIGLITKDVLPALLNQNMWRFFPNEKIEKEYLYHIVKELPLLKQGGARDYLTQKDFLKIKIPLPPIDVQKEIVAEIEGYQKIIDGARQVVENYKPRIQVDPDWPTVELGDICEINPETIIPETEYIGGTFNYIDISSVENGTGLFLGVTPIQSADAPSRARRKIQIGDVLLSTVRPNLKAFTLLNEMPENAVASTGFAVLRSKNNQVIPKYLLESVRADSAVSQMEGMMGKGAYPSINQKDVSMIRIPIPDLDTQRAIVEQIEEEQQLVNANKELIRIFEDKIKATINRVWGEKE